MLKRILAPRSEAVCSYCYENSIKVIGGNGEPVILQRKDITFCCFANILKGVFFCFFLADTSGKTRTLRDPVATDKGLLAASNYPTKEFTPHTFSVSETRSNRVGGGSGGNFERSTGWYSVSRSTGARPAARINRSSSLRGVNSEVFAPAS